MFHDVQQNTDYWHELRAGKLTGSAIAKVMANFGKAFGDPAKKLAVDIAVTQITGKSFSDGYTSAHMERGHEQEPLARIEYEAQYFCDVTNGGFFDNGFTGCSPDGLVDDGGVIEIKSVIPSVHYERIRNGKYDRTYHWQLVFNLKETGRDWIDFVSYCQAFTDEKKLIVFRLHSSDLQDEFKKIDQRVGEFRSLVDEIKNNIKEN